MLWYIEFNSASCIFCAIFQNDGMTRGTGPFVSFVSQIQFVKDTY